MYLNTSRLHNPSYSHPRVNIFPNNRARNGFPRRRRQRPRHRVRSAPRRLSYYWTVFLVKRNAKWKKRGKKFRLIRLERDRNNICVKYRIESFLLNLCMVSTVNAIADYELECRFGFTEESKPNRLRNSIIRISALKLGHLSINEILWSRIVLASPRFLRTQWNLWFGN